MKHIIEAWTDKYKKSIDCSNPKGFSQKAHCAGRKKREDVNEKKEMDPRKHVARSKRNPDMFCVFDSKGREVKLFKKKSDAEGYAIKNHDSLMVEKVYADSGLGKWFGSGSKGGAGGGGWDRYNTKGERIGKCGDAKEAEGKPKCLSKAKAAKLRAQGGKKAIANAVRRKKAKDPQVDRPGTGNKPINVSNRIKKSENVNSYLDKVRERRVKESSHTS